jgi:hypothetical protein
MTKRIPGVNWSANDQTVVLVLSTHCHFCTKSAPFFRQMTERAGKVVKFIAVMPESVTEAKSYLSDKGVHLDDVRQISVSAVGVNGTPTMLLVSKDGVVKRSWVGRLAPEKQQEALNAILGGNRASAAGNMTVAAGAGE